MTKGQRNISALLAIIAILLTLNLSLDVSGQRRNPRRVPEMPVIQRPPLTPGGPEWRSQEYQIEALEKIAEEIHDLRISVEALGPQIKLPAKRP